LLLGCPKLRIASSSERVSLERKGINQTSIRCFKACYVNGNFYNSTTAGKSKKQCDFVAEVNGDYFLVSQIFLVNSMPLCFASRISVTSLDNLNFVFKVNRILKEKVLLKLSSIKSKFIVKRSIEGALENFVKIPNYSMVVE